MVLMLPGQKLLSVMSYVPIAIRLELTKESMRGMMDFDDEIRSILFEIGRDIKIHKIDNDNMIIEIDYEKYLEKFKSILGGYNDTPGTLD